MEARLLVLVSAWPYHERCCWMTTDTLLSPIWRFLVASSAAWGGQCLLSGCSLVRNSLADFSLLPWLVGLRYLLVVQVQRSFDETAAQRTCVEENEAWLSSVFVPLRGDAPHVCRRISTQKRPGGSGIGSDSSDRMNDRDSSEHSEDSQIDTKCTLQEFQNRRSPGHN